MSQRVINNAEMKKSWHDEASAFEFHCHPLIQFDQHRLTPFAGNRKTTQPLDSQTALVDTPHPIRQTNGSILFDDEKKKCTEDSGTPFNRR